jgi:acetyltransferase-like isoleucine patch superfamily enzyme
MKMLKILADQFRFSNSIRRPSFIGKLKLRAKYNCYISLKAKVYKYKKIELAENVFIHENVLLNYNCYLDDESISIKIGKKTKIMPFVILQTIESFIRIGDNCTIHPYSVLIGGSGGKGIEIGNGVRIAAGCSIVTANHRFSEPDTEIYLQGIVSKGIKICDNVWIGANVKILDGVYIGAGTIIGAGSVVTRSIDELSIAYGVPAKVVKRRE